MKRIVCSQLIVLAMVCASKVFAEEDVQVMPDVIYGHKDGLAMTLDVYRPKKAKRFGVDPKRLGVTGASSGGHLSLMLGTTGDDGDPKAADEVLRTSDRVAAVVAYCPPTDIRPWTRPSSSYYQNYPALRFDTAKAGDYSPRLHASADDAATLLVHGDADKLVPLEHSQAMLAELKSKGADAELLVLKGAEHAFKGDQARQAAEARGAWFVKKLAQGKCGAGSSR